MRRFALKGNIIFSASPDKIKIHENAYAVCEGGVSKGVFDILPEENIPVKDYTGYLIIPGLFDIHAHAPQYAFRGLGMDMQLLDWLNTYTFPEEGNYKDLTYARKAYEIFADELVKSGTTRACIFATVHQESTMLLMELLEKTGIKAYVGKVSMNRNCPEYLCERNGMQAVREWLKAVDGRFHNIKPILTPRFIPSCTDELMRAIGSIQEGTNLPLQSHLSENLSEIDWVKELVPQSTCYGDAYDRFSIFGEHGTTIMAHCVYSTEEEIALMKKRGIVIAHCPQSNTNLSSGIAPAKRYLQENMSIGLGSDVAAGSSLSILRAMADAIQVSKLRWKLVEEQYKPLTLDEAFYMGTKGGGSVFGKVGSFEPGYEFDAVILDDSNICSPKDVSVRDRLERLIYLADDRNVCATFVAGNAVLSHSKRVS